MTDIDRACEVSHCNEIAKIKGFCVKHYKAHWQHGNPEYLPPTLRERFDSMWIPVTETGCWLWEGAVNKYKRYGKIVHNKKHRIASRVAWELYRGPIPKGMCVCHTCDTPECVNPDHLWLGTHKDNMHDSIKKGRFVYPPRAREVMKNG